MEIRDDTWLSNIFENPVFKIETRPAAPTPDDSTSKIREEIARHAGQQSHAFYYAKVDTREIDVVRQLSSAGLYVVDVNVTFRIDPTAHTNEGKAHATADVVVREIEPAEHDETLDIAGSCFQYSRFHLDPLVSRTIADRIKRDWILNYIRQQRGDRLFVALIGERPVGFLAAISTEANGKKVCAIDLVGVSRQFQRRHVGQTLTQFFIGYYEQRCDYLDVGTQAANIPSMRLYQKMGFYINQTQYVLHGHLGVEVAGAR